MGFPLWNFSLAVYGAGAVQEECLDLQDRFGLDVNLILLCTFVGAVRGITLTADDIASARDEVRQWHEGIVRPLRAARRNLKAVALKDAKETAAAAQLRSHVKSVELESEWIEQTALQRWADARLAGRPSGKPPEAVAANLQALLVGYGVREQLGAAQAMKHLIAAALDRVVDK